MIMKTADVQVIGKTGADGFTLVELVVVIATVAVLAALLLPALAGTRPNTRAFQCLGNQRQLILAWQMYTQDNGEILPPNDYPFTTAVARDGTVMNWAFGSMAVNIDSIDASVLVNQKLSSLALYNTNSAVYRCPADTSLSQGHPRVRSVSMNGAVGTRWYSAGVGTGTSSPPPGVKPGDAVGGGWLTRIYQDPNPVYRTFGKTSSLTIPGPSMTWVIMDENPLTINDACLTICMQPYLVDYPANYHNGAAGISFADGHAEMHKWVDVFTGVPSGGGAVPQVSSDSQSQDLAWIQPRTSALK